MKLRTPSPALVISIIALVVASAGTGYAATQITSSQIKDGTIQSRDIKSGSIQSGRLSQGVQNILKRKTPVQVPKLAFEMIRKSGPENQPANQLMRVASVTVPAGAYVVTANTILTAFTGESDIIELLLGVNGSQGGTCILDFGGVTATALQTIAINDRQTPATLGMQLTRTVGAPTEIVLKCAAAIPWRASETSIIATRVDTIDLKEEK